MCLGVNFHCSWRHHLLWLWRHELGKKQQMNCALRIEHTPFWWLLKCHYFVNFTWGSAKPIHCKCKIYWYLSTHQISCLLVAWKWVRFDVKCVVCTVIPPGPFLQTALYLYSLQVGGLFIIVFTDSIRMCSFIKYTSIDYQIHSIQIVQHLLICFFQAAPQSWTVSVQAVVIVCWVDY